MPEDTPAAAPIDDDDDLLFSPPDTIIPNTIGAYLLRVIDDRASGSIITEKLPIIGWQCLPDPSLIGVPLTICESFDPTYEFIVYSDRYFWNDESGVLEGESDAIVWASAALSLLREMRAKTAEASSSTQH